MRRAGNTGGILHRPRQQLSDAPGRRDAPRVCSHANHSSRADSCQHRICFYGAVRMSRVVLNPRTAPPFPQAALPILRDSQLRKNVSHATDVIQAKRARLVAEKHDWQELRAAAAAIKDETLQHLDRYLIEFEERCTAAGGTVHWASSSEDARRMIVKIVQETNAKEVIKIKTMTSAEIDLNPALAVAGIHPIETDLAELILQLGEDEPSHIVVPALHVSRSQVREIFAHKMGRPDLSDDPQALTAAARS